MHAINPNKLLLSKWTAKSPQQKQKHFLVIKLIRDDEERVTHCVLEAVLTKRQFTLDWKALTSPEHWVIGWQ
jgi:tryptophan-rich hypothetical protein